MDAQAPKKRKAKEPNNTPEEDEDEFLVDIIKLRTKLVNKYKQEIKKEEQKLSKYKQELKKEEQKLSEAQNNLAILRSRPARLPEVKSEGRSPLLVPENSGAISRKKATTEKAKPQESKPTKKLVPKESHELITGLVKSSSPDLIDFENNLILSKPEFKLRSFVMGPAKDQKFATSSLDGVVNIWKVKGTELTASVVRTANFLTPQKGWPVDITWHPDGGSLFAVYTANGDDAQVATLDLNLSEDKVDFLDEKPHGNGFINSVTFMPWANLCFATGGYDRAVILWTHKEGSWKPETVHEEEHSNVVNGVAGLQKNNTILSAGADKRIVQYDVEARQSQYKYELESKCMSVLPNPYDFNLFMVQVRTPEKQLRLFDCRTKGKELHGFGWKQEGRGSRLAVVGQGWSPDGLHISSGSAGPKIHIFDIRYNAGGPSQSLQTHNNRVFKADWHPSMLISVSSVGDIGLHRRS